MARRARLLTGLSMLFVIAAVAAITASSATAAISDEQELTRFGSEGSGAGQLRGPWGIATDPVTGHVFVGEEGINYRVDEFTPWGDFVKAFGWDVAPGAVNEQQEVRVRAANGQFKLTFESSTTSDLAFDAPGSESEGPGSVEAALNALPSIGGVGGGGEVSVEAVPGTADGKTPFIYVVAFKGSLAATNVPQLTIADGTTPPTGGVPSTTLETRTRADGSAAGVGLESCTAESGCKAGLSGDGAGELAESARGVAVDGAGNVYVREVQNRRMQKFDSAGRFVLMAGGEVNKTKSAEGGSSEAERNLCTKASGDECGVGVAGNGPGQFGGGLGSGLTLCSGSLFAADDERIQRFNLAGEYQAELPEPGQAVQKLACDPVSGDLYASFEPFADVHRLDAGTGEEIGLIPAEGYISVATDSTGNVFVGTGSKVLEFDSDGKPLLPPSCCDGEQLPPPSPSGGHFRVNGLGINSVGTLYVAYVEVGIYSGSFIRSFGPPPVSFEGAPKVPPSITAQFASSVELTGATVAAEINSHFWTNTRYYVEYGTGKCSEGGCNKTSPVPPGAILTSKVIDVPLKSAGVFLEDLQPGTTYHYRFVAESGGGGPVRGVGGEVGLDGEESTFTTYPVASAPKIDCSNQSFRTGPSASLPDCRAYEMVSPIDKNNGDIISLLTINNFTTALSQSALDGGRFTYSSYRAFADSKAAPYTSQYVASREDGVGWSSEAVEPAIREFPFTQGDSLDNHAKAFSPDLCSGWLMALAEPVPAPRAPEGYRNIYRRDNCGGGGYEALIQVQPSVSKAGAKFFPIMQGTSADGKEAIFMVIDKLTPEAPSGVWQAYYASKGELNPLCVLPSGLPSAGNCSGGTSDMGSAPQGGKGGFVQRERDSSLAHAISNDGGIVYWTDSGGKESVPGQIYLRLNPAEEQSDFAEGKCSEPEKACTLEVSGTVSPKASRFLGASPDGLKAIFLVTEGAQKGNLYKYDFETGESTLIAKGSPGVAGASKELSRVYFVSTEALPGTSGAVPGKANLYLDEEGTKTFIATLLGDSLTLEEAVTNANPAPIYHPARASSDGRALAFTSSASLTGYDNTDLASGRADSEVYLYEVGSSEPVCVSCNPSGARPLGRVVDSDQLAGPTAAYMPLAENSLYAPRVLSGDGRRLFFNSFDALLPRDTNGKLDVYEWEAASGQKECDEKGAELYVASSGGCLSLLSTGQSPSDSTLLDTSEGGRDAFFTTNASLLPQDPGLVDVYDARENGGLPAPPEPPGPCQGEACQLAPAPPNDPTPASASFKGAGNLKPRSRCAKGKVARKGRCVAKKRGQAKKHKHARTANHNRRQGR